MKHDDNALGADAAADVTTGPAASDPAIARRSTAKEQDELLLAAKQMLRRAEKPNMTHTRSYRTAHAWWKAVIARAEKHRSRS